MTAIKIETVMDMMVWLHETDNLIKIQSVYGQYTCKNSLDCPECRFHITCRSICGSGRPYFNESNYETLKDMFPEDFV